MDCAWVDWSAENQNLGCDGGFAAPAMQWIIDNGGAPLFRCDSVVRISEAHCRHRNGGPLPVPDAGSLVHRFRQVFGRHADGLCQRYRVRKSFSEVPCLA